MSSLYKIYEGDNVQYDIRYTGTLRFWNPIVKVFAKLSKNGYRLNQEHLRVGERNKEQSGRHSIPFQPNEQE